MNASVGFTYRTETENGVAVREFDGLVFDFNHGDDVHVQIFYEHPLSTTTEDWSKLITAIDEHTQAKIDFGTSNGEYTITVDEKGLVKFRCMKFGCGNAGSMETTVSGHLCLGIFEAVSVVLSK